MAKRDPKANGSNGVARNADGTFGPGNKAAAGRTNPYAARVAAWRDAVVKAVTPEDMQEVIQNLVAKAKKGEPWAVKEFLMRTLGKPTETDLIERIERLEEIAAARMSK